MRKPTTIRMHMSGSIYETAGIAPIKNELRSKMARSRNATVASDNGTDYIGPIGPQAPGRQFLSRGIRFCSRWPAFHGSDGGDNDDGDGDGDGCRPYKTGFRYILILVYQSVAGFFENTSMHHPTSSPATLPQHGASPHTSFFLTTGV